MYIDDWSLLTSSGSSPREVEENFGAHFQARGVHWQAAITSSEVDKWSKKNSKSDRIHHLALACADALSPEINKRCLVNIGSSRGATAFLEQSIAQFNTMGTVPIHSSPISTLGAVSSFVAHHLKTNGAVLDHSMTCSTSLQAVVNGFAHLKSGLVDTAVVGGVEAPLTEFTFSQFEALRLMSKENENPCHPLIQKSSNTMVIGEGAGLVKMTKEKTARAKWEVQGIGQALESAKHLVGIEGEALKISMQRALETAGISKVDLVLAHAPGTKLGDEIELQQIRELLGQVDVVSNKWAFGHTFGASGILSLIWAGWLLDGWSPKIPLAYQDSHQLSSIPETVMINAIGFGGSAVSIILKKA